MKQLNSLLCVLALFSVATQFALADQIVLKNGDRLTGKVVSTSEEKVTIITELAGTVTISRTNVEKVIIDPPEVKVINVSDQREPDQSATVPANADSRTAAKTALTTGWDGSVNVGFSLTSGNADTSTFTAGIRAEKSGKSDKWTTYLNSLISRNRVADVNVTTSNAIWGGLRYDRNLTKKIFAFASYDFERDKPQRLNFRSVLGAGLGYHVIKNEKTELDVFSGAAWNRTWFVGADNTSSAEVQIGNTLKHKFTERIKLQQGFTLYPNISNTGDYRFVFDSTLSADVTKRIGVFVTIGDRFNSAPLIGVERNDFLFATGLKWAFGKSK